MPWNSMIPLPTCWTTICHSNWRHLNTEASMRRPLSFITSIEISDINNGQWPSDKS